MEPILIIAILMLAVIFGIILGKIFSKIFIHRKEKKLLDNLYEVMEGKRENKIEIDGKVYDASKFILRDEEGNETMVDLKGGIIKNVEKENKEIEEGSDLEELPPIARKDSRSIGKEKRNIGSKLRRFG